MKVKGRLINPTVLLGALDGIAGIEELQVVVQRQDPNDPHSMDEMLVRVAAPGHDQALLSREIIGRAQDAVRVRPRVEFVAAQDAAARTKAVRFVERR